MTRSKPCILPWVRLALDNGFRCFTRFTAQPHVVPGISQTASNHEHCVLVSWYQAAVRPHSGMR